MAVDTLSDVATRQSTRKRDTQSYKTLWEAEKDRVRELTQSLEAARKQAKVSEDIAALRTMMEAMAKPVAVAPVPPVIAEDATPVADAPLPYPDIPGEWTQRLREERRPSGPRPYCLASSIGDVCQRRLYYECLGAPRSEPSDELLGIFDLGNELEQVVRQRLGLLGYRLDRSQETLTLMDDTGDVIVKGRPDGIVWKRGDRRKWVLDAKSCSGYVFDRIPSDPVEAGRWLETADHIWMRRYPDQIRTYVLALSGEVEDDGLLLFVNKETGLFKLAVVHTSEGDLPVLKGKALLVLDAVSERKEPPFCSELAACERCDFKDHCNPAATIDAANVIDPDAEENDEIVEAVRHWIGTKGMRAEAAIAEKMKDSIRDRMKALGIGRYVIPGVGAVVVRKHGAGVAVAIEEEGDTK